MTQETDKKIKAIIAFLEKRADEEWNYGLEETSNDDILCVGKRVAFLEAAIKNLQDAISA
jgi:hypothetical protein